MARRSGVLSGGRLVGDVAGPDEAMVRIGLAADLDRPLQRFFEDVVDHRLVLPRAGAGSKQKKIGAKRSHACVIDGGSSRWHRRICGNRLRARARRASAGGASGRGGRMDGADAGRPGDVGAGVLADDAGVDAAACGCVRDGVVRAGGWAGTPPSDTRYSRRVRLRMTAAACRGRAG